VHFGGTVVLNDTVVTGEVSKKTPPTFDLVDRDVDWTLAALAASNDNARLLAVVAASGGAWEVSSGVLKAKVANPPKLVVPAGRYRLSGIDIQQNSFIEFGPGDSVIAVLGDVKVQQNSGFLLNATAMMKLYIKGNFQLQQGVVVNPGDSPLRPSQFQLFGHSDGGSLQIQQHTQIFGALYWPGGDVQIQQGVELFGGVVGEKVQIEQNAKIHYDAGVGNVSRLGSLGMSAYRKTLQD
jgi:hypothetical protein